jgi:hypothetical protein
VGRWVIEEGQPTRGIFENMELLKDGTGIVDKMGVTWKTENRRIYFTTSLDAIAYDYRISSSTLTLTNDDGQSIKYQKAVQEKQVQLSEEQENNAKVYTNLMKNIPEEFGDWKRTKTSELPDYAREQLKIIGAKNWTYVNTRTDERVNVSFLVGPTGRLAIQTPEANMDSEGFMISQERQRESFSGNAFWRVVIASKMAATDYQIVFYYALGTGRQWWAKIKPQSELSQYPFILKMLVETVPQTDPDDYNAARNFLKDFLPEVAKVYAETDLQGKYGK